MASSSFYCVFFFVCLLQTATHFMRTLVFLSVVACVKSQACDSYTVDKKSCGTTGLIGTNYSMVASTCCAVCSSLVDCVGWAHIGSNTCFYHDVTVLGACTADANGHDFYSRADVSLHTFAYTPAYTPVRAFAGAARHTAAPLTRQEMR